MSMLPRMRAWMFSSATSGCGAGKVRRRGSRDKRVIDGVIGMTLNSHAQVVGQRARIVHAAPRGVRARAWRCRARSPAPGRRRPGSRSAPNRCRRRGRPPRGLKAASCACSRADPSTRASCTERDLYLGCVAVRRCPEWLYRRVTHVLLKGGQHGDRAPVAVQGQAAAVEDQFVVGADLVHVDERARRAAGRGR